MAALLCSVTNVFALTESGTMLKVFTCEENNRTHFYIQNLERASVTATFDMRLFNLQASTNFPYTTALAANQTLEAFSLSPVIPHAPWNFSYVRSSCIGSVDAVPDNDFIYSLPYAPGSSFCVSQGYHGSFSHSGPDEYAIDWQMPIGTPVHAARGGLVVQSKDGDDRGGPKRKFEKYANCILIQHDDGTIGIYGHLKKNGSKVRVGDHVGTGDVIGLSGNTGFSNGPHLHFSVFKTVDGKTRLSLPVKFRSVENRAVTLVSGETYSAPSEVRLPDAQMLALMAKDAISFSLEINWIESMQRLNSGSGHAANSETALSGVFASYESPSSH
jgi:murein DD-endopeptidase MepM/ murein hydrolase activator NlpD